MIEHAGKSVRGAGTVMVLLGIFLTPLPALSKTLHVPGGYAAIQEAIDAAVDGDMVLVDPGTYRENINYKGKAIVVKSSGGPAGTAIDGAKQGSTVVFRNNEKPSSVLEGFMITNGSGTSHNFNQDGGGIFCLSASPTITGNVIVGNTTLFAGGGIFCENGSPEITRNTIKNNWVGYLGGGVFCAKSGAHIADNFIAWNGFTFTEMNGGIFFEGAPAPFIVNNFLIGNAAYDGAGICSTSSEARLLNNTIAYNKGGSLGWGGGVYFPGSSPVLLTNNIIRKNSPDQILGSSVIVVYCNIEGGWPGTGNIDADPLFVGPAQHDFHITCPSPCKDTGLSTAAGMPAEDFEGDPRIADGNVDMGSDEFHTHLYVTGDAAPGGGVEIKFVGLPGTSPVGLWIGTGMLDPPIPSMWGEWYLQFPIFGPFVFGAIPIPSGVLIRPCTVPMQPPAPYKVPMQALIGHELTNPFILSVK